MNERVEKMAAIIADAVNWPGYYDNAEWLKLRWRRVAVVVLAQWDERPDGLRPEGAQGEARQPGRPKADAPNLSPKDSS